MRLFLLFFIVALFRYFAKDVRAAFRKCVCMFVCLSSCEDVSKHISQLIDEIEVDNSLASPSLQRTLSMIIPKRTATTTTTKN